MKRSSIFYYGILVVVVVGGYFLFTFEKTSSPSTPNEKRNEKPAQVVDPGTDRSRVTLTEKARDRLGIATAQVAASPFSMPYAALLYEIDGSTWVYTNPESLMYVRHRVEVDQIEGDRVMLLNGPPPGTAIVITGAAELLGVEKGVGK